jgi:hypothetical protein
MFKKKKRGGGVCVCNIGSCPQVPVVRGCITSTKYWLPSTRWRLCQRLYYFYQILTAFNKLMTMLEFVLLLSNTDRLQQVEDYVRGCLILPNTECLQQVEDYVRGCITSTKYWLPSTSRRLCQWLYNSTKYWLPSRSWRLCQRLYYFYQILTAFNKLKMVSEVV